MKTTPRTMLTGLVAAAAFATLTSCSLPVGGEEARSTLTIGDDTLYVSNWDPIQGGVGGERYAWQALFDALTMWDWETMSFTPWLAEEITVGEDRQSMTFELRDDVDFHDGTHMDAAGVEKFYDAVLASEQYAFGGALVEYDVEFTATGEYTLEMTTSKPIYPRDFANLLSYPTPVLSPVAVDDPERALAEPMGSGPYLIDALVTDVEATFVRNPDYWNPEAFPFDTVVVKVLPDATARLNALKSGQIDAASLQLTQVAEAESSGLALHEGGGTYFALYVDDPANSVIPALRDPRVSRAIAMVFDREAIKESVGLGYGVVSNQAFIPSQPEYVEGADDRYPYDPEAARELLAEAGYPDGFDVTIPTYEAFSTVEPIIESSLAEIGIRVSWERFPADGFDHLKAYLSGEYPLILNQMFNVNTLRFLTGETLPGLGRLRGDIPGVADLVETIKRGDAEESAAASAELGEKVLDEALYIPILRPATIWGSAPDVSVQVSETTGITALIDFQLTG